MTCEPGPVAAVAGGASLPARAVAGLGRAWRGFTWYVKGMLGESDYDHYVAHLRAHHPDAVVPTVREYWRDRYDYESKNPAGRCC